MKGEISMEDLIKAILDWWEIARDNDPDYNNKDMPPRFVRLALKMNFDRVNAEREKKGKHQTDILKIMEDSVSLELSKNPGFKKEADIILDMYRGKKE